jgi:glucokinase
MAGEIWPSPYQGETIEDIVSGRGVSSIYQKLSSQVKSSKEISVLAFQGDPKAIEAWNIFGSSLAMAIAWGINLIDPGIVILGGSIANSMDLFHDSMEHTLRKFICPVPAAKTKIVKAALGDNAGFIGAAALVLQGR